MLNLQVGDETVLDYEIPENKQFNSSEFGEKLYSFGQLSDIHLPAISSAPAKFTSALEFFDDYGCEFVAISGDILQDNTEEELKLFRSTITGSETATGTIPEYNDMPIYVAAGNHDAVNVLGETMWQNYVGTPLYFEKIVDKGTVDTSDDDIFLFMGLYKWDGNGYFTDDEMTWLENKLIEHKGKTIFLEEHVFLGDMAGDTNKTYATHGGGIFNESAAQTKTFRRLAQEYKDNLIHFSGHSHFMFEVQRFDESLNIWDGDGTYYTAVHVPGCGRPDKSNSTGTARSYDDSQSQGYVVDVYDNCVILKGIDFITGKYLAEAMYVINK